MEVKSSLDLHNYIDRTNRTQETLLLFEHLADALAQIGFNCLNFYSLSGRTADEPGGKARWSRNYPEIYAADNIDRLLESGDPVVSSTHVLDGLCEWSALSSNLGLSISKQRILEARAADGLYAGVSIPLRAAYGVLANLELASTIPGTIHSEESLSTAYLMAVHFFQCFCSMHYQSGNADYVSLTCTEREVLILLSKGHTKNAASAELGVTSYAVDFHCRNIMKKYSTSKMVVAIVSALQSGLLPNSFR